MADHLAGQADICMGTGSRLMPQEWHGPRSKLLIMQTYLKHFPEGQAAWDLEGQ